MNSVRFVMQTIEHEARRQVEVLEEGGKIVQETRLFDPGTGTTRSMRSKEDAHDYRYFPDPETFAGMAQRADLIPVYRQLLADHLTPVTAFELLGRDDVLGSGPFAEVDGETAREILAEVDRMAREDLAESFEEADRKTPTGLAGYLKQRGIKTVFVTGLATDFCVAWTAMDARKLGFETYVVEDAARGIDLNGSLAAAWKQMMSKGVKRIQSSDIAIAV